jgi:hypothetical protein
MHFDLRFIISAYAGRVNTQALRLSSEDAWFFNTPVPDGGTPPSLKMSVRFRGAQLLHGKLDPKRKKIVHTAI